MEIVNQYHKQLMRYSLWYISFENSALQILSYSVSHCDTISIVKFSYITINNHRKPFPVCIATEAFILRPSANNADICFQEKPVGLLISINPAGMKRVTSGVRMLLFGLQQDLLGQKSCQLVYVISVLLQQTALQKTCHLLIAGKTTSCKMALLF